MDADGSGPVTAAAREPARAGCEPMLATEPVRPATEPARPGCEPAREGGCARRQLRLNGSGLGPRAAAAISAALSANATGLTELWIGSNKLGAAGAAAVAAGVAASATLERAWLDAAGMAPDAAPAAVVGSEAALAKQRTDAVPSSSSGEARI